MPTTSESSTCTQSHAPVTNVSSVSVTTTAPAVVASGSTSGGLTVSMPLPVHMVSASPSTIAPTSAEAATIAVARTQTTTAVTSCGAAACVTSWTAGGNNSSGGNSGGHLTVPLVGGGTTSALATLSYVHGSTGIRLIPATAVSGMHPAVAPPINNLVREVRRCSDSSRAQGTITTKKVLKAI